MELLAGHAVQGQAVLPAAAYVAMALEASQLLTPSDDIHLIELMEFTIHRTLPFDQGDAGIQIVAELADMAKDQSTAGDRTIRALFTYEAALDAQTDNLSLVASARVVIHLGQPSEFLLPP
jgi:hybrid polyketide synthase / nonribosomal peptide synthetase ACE1